MSMNHLNPCHCDLRIFCVLVLNLKAWLKIIHLKRSNVRGELVELMRNNSSAHVFVGCNGFNALFEILLVQN